LKIVGYLYNLIVFKVLFAFIKTIMNKCRIKKTTKYIVTHIHMKLWKSIFRKKIKSDRKCHYLHRPFTRYIAMQIYIHSNVWYQFSRLARSITEINWREIKSLSRKHVTKILIILSYNIKIDNILPSRFSYDHFRAEFVKLMPEVIGVKSAGCVS